MMPRSGLRAALIVADDRPVGSALTVDTDRALRAEELPASAPISVSCFEHCSPVRTRCPGPAARLSAHDGRWTPICRRNAG